MGYNMVKIGSKWYSTEMQLFEVRGVEQRSDGTWVSYGPYGTDRMYECLVDAFLSRFREHIN